MSVMNRDTRHMSTSDVSDPKPDMVEPTRYRLYRGNVFWTMRRIESFNYFSLKPTFFK